MGYRNNALYNRDWFEAGSLNNSTNENILTGGNHPLLPGQSMRTVQHITWTEDVKQYYFSELFEIKVNDKLSFNTGLQFEMRSYTEQTNTYGSKYLPDSITFPLKPDFLAPGSSIDDINRVLHYQQIYSAYIHSKYLLSKKQFINLDIRLDHNSVYGSSPTLRAGYVQNMGIFTGKLIYGQAYQPPFPRYLYGSFSDLGSSPSLEPERTQTLEASLSIKKNKIASTISAYHVINTNTIIQTNNTAKNIGQRNITGIDIHFLSTIHVPYTEGLKLWAYYAAILDAQEEKFSDKTYTGTGNIGDLSYHNIYLGSNIQFSKSLSLNIIGQYVGKRKTVDTNPVDQIDPYLNLNTSLLYQNLFFQGMHLRLKIHNLLNTEYYHPGIKLGDAGETPGVWNNGIWNGSQGFYNSKLPQAHRYFLFSLLFDLK